ncbi:MAG: DUF1015 domain-containing protein [Acidimicrobiia bacterium]
MPVPDLAPFRGLRYTTGPDLTAVTAPPYDVIEPAERDALAASASTNAVHLILPEDPSGGGDPYAAAAAALADWRARGVLVADTAPLLYAYRMDAPLPGGATHRTIGVIGALGLPPDPATGDVLPHERTLPKAKSDRLALLRATRANFDPIWGLSLAVGLTELAADVPAVAWATDGAGVRHEIGLIDDPERIEKVRAVVRSRPVVLADGHHRFETACTYRAESASSGSDAILCLVVELDDAQLDVRPFHRVVRGGPADLRERLAGAFTIRDAGAANDAGVAALLDEMAARRALGLIDRDGLALLAPDATQEQVLDAELPECLRDVDAARFDVAVKPLLGDDATLAYRNDVVAVSHAVATGDADAAILLRPAPIDAIGAAADAGVRMPEKTTYFAPKPRTGMVMRSLDE